MLVLSRKVGEKILIGDNISVTVVRVAQGTVRIGVEAPEDLPIVRGIEATLYARLINRFPVFIDNTLKLATYVTLPLALLSIGGALTLRTLKDHLGLSLTAAGFKLVLLPLIGFLFLKWFRVDGLAFKIGMVFFTLPTSTALYVLSAQLNSDTRLASAAIALSTVLSFVSLSIALLL